MLRMQTEMVVVICSLSLSVWLPTGFSGHIGACSVAPASIHNKLEHLKNLQERETILNRTACALGKPAMS